MVTEVKNWQDAQQNCIEMGARLMEIRTQEEFETASRFNDEMGTDFFLGGIKAEGNWVWNSNEEEIDELNEFWGSGRPVDHPTRHCIDVFNGMLDSNCFRLRKSVCQYN